jgi:hypothetical protein
MSAMQLREVRCDAGKSAPLFRVEVPLKTVSALNAREHYMARSRRVKAEREAIAWKLGARRAELALPVVVTLQRCAPSSGLDSDNLLSSLKGCRDQVAKWLGVDDRDPRVEWRYAQGRTLDYRVIVEVQAA